MKKLLFAVALSTLGLGATAQTAFEFGLYGMANNPWIINNTIADQGADQDFAPAFKFNFGASAAARIAPQFAVMLEVGSGSVAQKWQGEIDSGETYESGVRPSSTVTATAKPTRSTSCPA